MKKILTVLMLLSILSCNNESAEEALLLITKTEKELFDTEKQFDVAKADMLIRNYDKFATNHPEHEKAAAFLFRAGDLSLGRRQSDQAIKFFDRIINDYPDFEKAPDALFLKAFTLDDQLKDYPKAKETYQAFIDQYPDHGMASSAEFSIKNLGKSPEDLVKEFEERAAAAKSDTSQVQ